MAYTYSTISISPPPPGFSTARSISCPSDGKKADAPWDPHVHKANDLNTTSSTKEGAVARRNTKASEAMIVTTWRRGRGVFSLFKRPPQDRSPRFRPAPVTLGRIVVAKREKACRSGKFHWNRERCGFISWRAGGGDGDGNGDAYAVEGVSLSRQAAALL